MGDLSLSDLDPTTSTGLTNLATGGLYEVQKDPITNAWGELTGEEEAEALQQQIADQASAQMEQIEFLREQYGDTQAALQPYREAGQEFLPQLTEMLSPEARTGFIQNYLAGDEYQALQDQATSQLLQSAAATGTLGSSGTQDRLARQTMQMGSQYGTNAYNQALSNLTQGTNLGFQTFGPELQAQSALNQGVNTGLSNVANLQLGAASMNQGGLLGQLAPFAPLAGAYIGG